jgi:creatinine amidohydrolase
VLLEKCSWMDVSRRLEVDRRIVIVLGATEEHSDLSVATDTLIPFTIARESCARENVLLAPPLPFGISTWSLAYPGTMSLQTATYCAVVKDLLRSLLHGGFRHFVFLNGHGFNRAVSPAVGEALFDKDGATAAFIQWWELPEVKEFARSLDAPYGHANWAEAFPFTVLDGQRTAQPATGPSPDLLQSAASIRRQFGPGHGAGPVRLDDEVMAKLLELAVSSFQKVLAAIGPGGAVNP